jgi:hypothetical protein
LSLEIKISDFQKIFIKKLEFKTYKILKKSLNIFLIFHSRPLPSGEDQITATAA